MAYNGDMAHNPPRRKATGKKSQTENKTTIDSLEITSNTKEETVQIVHNIVSLSVFVTGRELLESLEGAIYDRLEKSGKYEKIVEFINDEEPDFNNLVIIAGPKVGVANREEEIETFQVSFTIKMPK